MTPGQAVTPFGFRVRAADAKSTRATKKLSPLKATAAQLRRSPRYVQTPKWSVQQSALGKSEACEISFSLFSNVNRTKLYDPLRSESPLIRSPSGTLFREDAGIKFSTHARDIQICFMKNLTRRDEIFMKMLVDCLSRIIVCYNKWKENAV